MEISLKHDSGTDADKLTGMLVIVETGLILETKLEDQTSPGEGETDDGCCTDKTSLNLLRELSNLLIKSV